MKKGFLAGFSIGLVFLISPIFMAAVTPGGVVTTEVPVAKFSPLVPSSIKHKTSPTVTVTRMEIPSSQVIFLRSAINDQSISVALQELRQKEENGLPIYILIDSPGGGVDAGIRLINAMEVAKVPVNTVCLEMCASMAAMIHQFGKERLSEDRAVLMFHPASGGLRPGQVPNMLSELAWITRSLAKLNAYIVGRSKMPPQLYESLIAYGFWIDSEDAMGFGLVDGLVNVVVK